MNFFKFLQKRRKAIGWGMLGAATVWLIGDYGYSRYVAFQLKKWEASIERDKDGVQRDCREYTVGEGETAILLVHGINDSPRCYDKMAPALAKQGFTCRVMRLPGFAESTQQYANATKEKWIAAVQQEVKTLRKRHRRVAVIGHSLGGAVTIAYLRQNPNDVDAAVLLAPAVEVSSRRSPLLSTRVWHEIGQRMLLFTKVTYSPFTVDVNDPAAKVHPGRTSFTPITVADQTFALLDQNRGQAAQIKTPLLTILSKTDQIIDWQAAQRYHQQTSSKRKQLRFTKSSGHTIPLDYDWEEVTEHIAEFVQTTEE